VSDEPTDPQHQKAAPNGPDAQPDAPAQATAGVEPSGAEAPPPPPAQTAAARTPGGFGRFVRHRATQIVAAGLAGLVIGGGAVALISHDGPRGRDNYGYHAPRGHGPYWDHRPYRDFRDGPRVPQPR
jgi:hypothetical protein